MGFKSVLKTMFPYIATAAEVGGPIGVMAANAVGNALGVNNVKADDLEKTIQAAQVKDPEALLKLQQAEASFQLQMKKLGLDNIEALERIAAEDRASARSREIAVRDHTNQILAYITVAGFFLAMAGLITRDIPGTTRDLIMVLLGVLASAFKDIFSYYYGSSSGSAKKSEVIADVVASGTK